MPTIHDPETLSASPEEFERAYSTVYALLNALSTVIKGRHDTIKLTLTALLADGHALLEDYPGSGKTTLAKTLGRLISKGHSDYDHCLPFRRVQFTPDMLPGDVLGVNVFEPKSGSFRFMHGPIFAHIVLADEINRTGPKVQSAFLECMAEKQVTIDNVTYQLDDLFFVLGTQNPLDMAGTYPLPLVQLDRFLFKIPMSYVDSKTEFEILAHHSAIKDASQKIAPVCSREDVLFARSVSDRIYLSGNIRSAIVNIIQSTRNNPAIQYGASTRAAVMLQSALKAWALLQQRDFVHEDDLKYITPYVLLHRLRFIGGAGEPHEILQKLIAPHIDWLLSQKI
jgi:MoxR-like ATPase